MQTMIFCIGHLLKQPFPVRRLHAQPDCCSEYQVLITAPSTGAALGKKRSSAVFNGTADVMKRTVSEARSRSCEFTGMPRLTSSTKRRVFVEVAPIPRA